LGEFGRLYSVPERFKTVITQSYGRLGISYTLLYKNSTLCYQRFDPKWLHEILPLGPRSDVRFFGLIPSACRLDIPFGQNRPHGQSDRKFNIRITRSAMNRLNEPTLQTSGLPPGVRKPCASRTWHFESFDFCF